MLRVVKHSKVHYQFRDQRTGWLNGPKRQQRLRHCSSGSSRRGVADKSGSKTRRSRRRAYPLTELAQVARGDTGAQRKSRGCTKGVQCRRKNYRVHPSLQDLSQGSKYTGNRLGRQKKTLPLFPPMSIFSTKS